MMGLLNSGSFMPHCLISYWIDLVQRTSFLIKALGTRSSQGWLWNISTIQLNPQWGIFHVCPFLVVVTSVIQRKRSLRSSRISVLLCQSPSIPEAPWGLVRAEPCAGFWTPKTIAVNCGNSKFNVLVRKTGIPTLFSIWIASSDA